MVLDFTNGTMVTSESELQSELLTSETLLHESNNEEQDYHNRSKDALYV